MSLSVHVKATDSMWRFGDHTGRSGNLGGTTRTLDETNGFASLEPGLMARNGWAIVDDSRTLVFDQQGWLTARAAPANLDLYFFGYGHDYVACLQDFQQVAGGTPLIPAGSWATGGAAIGHISQDELLALMDEFEAHEMPLSVCIVDMDWHVTQTGKQSVGWTGYTWNRELFPDPEGFIDGLHAKGLKTALNLHPAEGIHPHEEQYPELASAGASIPAGESDAFDCADRRFARVTSSCCTTRWKPRASISGGWTGSRERSPSFMGWIHCGGSIICTSTTWARRQQAPFIFSRWGGLGNHRYPIGFSGDTVVGWEALAFQPSFTAAAANVGYGWWSHDIGGHMWGVEDDELYARWVQYGVFSPILRLHSTNNPYSERRPWGGDRLPSTPPARPCACATR